MLLYREVDERPGPPRVLKVSRERHDGRGLPCLLFVSNLDLPITVSLYHYEHSFPTISSLELGLILKPARGLM